MIVLEENKRKTKTFDYYLRHCKCCGEIYKAYAKDGCRPKSRMCNSCKEDVYKKRTEAIMKTKQLIMEVENEYNRELDFKSETFI